MPGIESPLIIDGVAVVTAPGEIDVTTAEQLRMVLLDAACHGHGTVVVDLTGTRLCDSSGLNVLAAAHRRALAEDGELRLVPPADGNVAHVVAVTRMDWFIPCCGSLGEALDQVAP